MEIRNGWLDLLKIENGQCRAEVGSRERLTVSPSNGATMFRKLLNIILLAVVLSACATSTPIPTQTPLPLPTSTDIPTPIPFSQLNLESLIIETGDLPAGLSGAQIRNVAPAMYDNIPVADYTIFQQFEKDSKAAGGVAVFVYETTENIDKAYQAILSGMTDAESSSEIGDKANVLIVSRTIGKVTIEASEAIFNRCSAVVHIRMVGYADDSSIVSYAQRLDKRLSPIVCR